MHIRSELSAVKALGGNARTTIGLIAVAAVLGAAVGAGIVTAMTLTPKPAILQQASTTDTSPISMRPFDDPVDVTVTVRSDSPQPLTIATSGTITTSQCLPGSVISSGALLFTVNDNATVALATAVPLWRDITIGTQGADVVSLKAELSRLGYPTTSGDQFDRADLASAASLFRAAGSKLGEGVSRDRVVWIPRSATLLDRCTVRIGDTVTAGASVAIVQPDIHVTGVVLPDSRLPGPRKLTAFGLPLQIDEKGAIASSPTQQQIRDSKAFLEAAQGKASDFTVSVPSTARLTTAVQAAAVPATAIFSDEASRACVFNGTDSIVVSIVGSEFGNTYVVFPDGNTPSSVNSTVQKGTARCSSK